MAQQRLAAGPAWADMAGRLVFPTDTGNWTDPRSATRGMTAIARNAGVATTRVVHALRHSGAALMVADGVPLPVVQQMLGRKDISTTVQHYGHIEGSQA